MRVSTEPSRKDPAINRDNRDPSTKDPRAPVQTGDKDKARYTPSPEELVVIKAQLARLATHQPVVPGLKVNQGTISANHPDGFIADMLLREALGTADFRISNGLIKQLARAAAEDGEIHEWRLNFLLALMTVNKPRNELEAMLKAQMAAVHMAAMDCAGRLGQVDFGPQFDSVQNAFNKLARTFAMQLETLKRYQSGADDRDILLQQNVSVTQAIVGNVHQIPKETLTNGRPTSTPSQTDAPGVEVLTNGAQGRRDRRPKQVNEE